MFPWVWYKTRILPVKCYIGIISVCLWIILCALIYTNRDWRDAWPVPWGLFSHRWLIRGLKAALSASTGAIKRGPRDVMPSIPLWLLSDPTPSYHGNYGVWCFPLCEPIFLHRAIASLRWRTPAKRGAQAGAVGPMVWWLPIGAG